MLCMLCETFTSNILDQDFVAWKRHEPSKESPTHCVRSKIAFLTFKHGNYFTIAAAAAAGCQICALFNRERERSIPDFHQLSEKWLYQSANVDFKLEDRQPKVSLRKKIEFALSTKAPTMLWNEFELYLPDKNLLQTKLSNCVIQSHAWMFSELPKQISARANDEPTIENARKWLDDCRLHPACSRPCATRLPSRLIDVGPPNIPSDPVLRDTRDNLVEYATLSHCWGSGLSLKTTKCNVEAHRASISLCNLPATFRDAIVYTRALGLRFLWIDALCIIQDDETDWQREAAAMCSIFENGAVCLSALFAESSGAGFLQQRTLDQITFELQGMTFGIRPRTDTLPEAIESSKLETRAWCLQERMLAPATIYFGRHQSYWLCRSTIKPCPVICQEFASSETVVLDLLWFGMRDLASLSDTSSLTAWWGIVQNYSARHITKPSDRLPAVAGLVEKFLRRWPASYYVHGLWSHAMLSGLLWRREPVLLRIRSKDENGIRTKSSDSHSEDHKVGTETLRRRTAAPSWSWACVNAAVCYNWVYTLSPQSQSNCHYQAVLLDNYCGPRKSSDNLLNIEAYMKRGACRLVHRNSALTGDATFRPSNSKIVDETLSCRMDFADDFSNSKACYCMRVATFVSSATNSNVNTTYTFYLLLERTPSNTNKITDMQKPRFRRIGVGADLTRKVDKVFANAVKHTLELV